MVKGDHVSGSSKADADRLGRAERAVAAIGTSLDPRRTASELTAFLVEECCDTATVDLFTPRARDRHPDGSLQAVAVAGRRDLLDALEKMPRGDVRVRALDEGHPITRSFSPRGGTSLVAVSMPLLAGSRVYGVVLALRTGTPFDDEETAAVHYAARLAAAHLRHAEEHRQVGARVWDLQQVLRADPGRPHPNVEVATRYLPVGRGTHVGGDWCETVRLHYGRTLLVVGDVMGHGLDAAVDMNAYRSVLRYIASSEAAPHVILRRVDTAVSEESGRRPATCLLALLDPVHGTVSLAGAGHLPPAVFPRRGTAELVPLPIGPPLGTGLGAYEPFNRPLAGDDTLVLFTDGLVERRGEDIETSLGRLTALRLPPDQDVSALLDDILDRLGAEHADDDVAAVAARPRRRP
ncbi:PP2C family protein-serine/threonine phosphatase [Streptomyces sp. NPDC003697]